MKLCVKIVVAIGMVYINSMIDLLAAAQLVCYPIVGHHVSLGLYLLGLWGQIDLEHIPSFEVCLML